MSKYRMGVLGGMLLIGGAASAQANLVITAHETGFTDTNILTVVGVPSSDIQGATSVTFGDFKINILGAEADTDGTPSVSELLASSTKIVNAHIASPGTHTLTLTISATNYTSPLTPGSLLLDSQIGGSVAIGNAANVLAFQGFVDPTNVPTTSGAFTPGPQSVPITASASYNSDATKTISSLVNPYAIVETITYTLGSNSQVNFSSSEILSVPEPASLTLVGVAGAGLLARRRRSSAK